MSRYKNRECLNKINTYMRFLSNIANNVSQYSIFDCVVLLPDAQNINSNEFMGGRGVGADRFFNLDAIRNKI